MFPKKNQCSFHKYHIGNQSIAVIAQNRMDLGLDTGPAISACVTLCESLALSGPVSSDTLSTGQPGGPREATFNAWRPGSTRRTSILVPDGMPGHPCLGLKVIALPGQQPGPPLPTECPHLDVPAGWLSQKNPHPRTGVPCWPRLVQDSKWQGDRA